MLSPTPIAKIIFEESGSDTDDVGVRQACRTHSAQLHAQARVPLELAHAHPFSRRWQLYFGLKDADLLDEVPADLRTVFWCTFNLFIVIMLGVDMLVWGRICS